MKRVLFILLLLCLTKTIVHAQRYWSVTSSESGLNGKVHEVVTMTYFPEDSTGLGLMMAVETRLFSSEGLLTHLFESNPGNDYFIEYVYNGEILTDIYYYADAEYHYQYNYSIDGTPTLIVVSAVQGENFWSSDTINVAYENGKVILRGDETPPNETFTQVSFPTNHELDAEIFEYDKVGNWIYRKRGKWIQTRHIVYW